MVTLVSGECGFRLTTRRPRRRYHGRSSTSTARSAPILSESCYQCHGPDRNKRKANLRLGSCRDGLFQSAGGTTIVAPGKPDESELLARITSDDPELRMPPPKSGPHLTPEQVELIKRWIAQGAVWKGHWAYLRPERPAIPVIAGQPALTNEIDRLIRAGLAHEHLEPAPEADRRTLVRRLSFDLIGLPPAPAEVDAFVNDNRPEAYERLVDRLLSSPHFGERMAIFWLDLVRFADTTGYHSDNHVDLYLFRDYVIRAFNANKPFDRFTIEQIAGDLVEGSTDETRVASGYNRLLQTTQEGGGQAKEYLAKYSADRVRNVSTVWLVATAACAECWRPQNSTPIRAANSTALPPSSPTSRKPPWERRSRPGSPLGLRPKSLSQSIASSPYSRRSSKLTEAQAQRAGRAGKLPESSCSSNVPARSSPCRSSPVPSTCCRAATGSTNPGPSCCPRCPAFLPPLWRARTAGRPDSIWPVGCGRGDNPLVARVMVNRLWKLVFGQALVATPDDFGSQGAWPTHHELLDWLACQFIDDGWDIKGTLKRMVMTETYRRSSAAPASTRQRDPANIWMSHQNRYRLDAELVRDGALASSGLLSGEIGGPSVKPYQPDGYWTFLNFPRRDYVADNGENQYRRALYTYWQRTFLHPSLLAFDASTREECVVQRPRSNTPLQALVLLNDPSYVEAARGLAARVIREACGQSGSPRTSLFDLVAFATCPPRRGHRPHESAQQALRSICRWSRHARALLSTGNTSIPPGIDPAELAAWTSVARVLLNLHETITRS